MQVTMRCFISHSDHLAYCTFACPLRQVPIRSLQHVWCKNVVAYLRRATKYVECANVFLPLIFHAYECCMAKLICVRYQTLAAPC